MESAYNASCAFRERLRNDTEYADVELFFAGGVVLTAHAVVLASTSDYCKEAVSAKWTHGRDGKENFDAGTDEGGPILAHITKKRRTDAKPTARKLTLNHPNVDAATAKVVLDFFYLGTVKFPQSLALSVIAFADEISCLQRCPKVQFPCAGNESVIRTCARILRTVRKNAKDRKQKIVCAQYNATESADITEMRP
ncbi:hypothetical protein HDU81_006707 [Chytriomyces hyalinus]|nr:hypothetical protein HDU81_006707 [Chytriomyces hyalinus]